VAPLRLGGRRGKQSTPRVWLGGTGEHSAVGKREDKERGTLKFWQNCVEMVSVKSPLAIRLVNGYWQKKKKYLSLEHLLLFILLLALFTFRQNVGLAVLFILAKCLCLACMFTWSVFSPWYAFCFWAFLP
jgi:hypothetical protein